MSGDAELSPPVYLALNELFDAAIVPAAWPTALDKLARSLGAAGGIIIPREPERIEQGFPTGHTLVDVMSAFVGGGWHRNDIRADRGWPMLASSKTVIIEHDLVDESERLRLPYYQELFDPFGLPWFAGIGFKVDGHQWCLTLIRGAGQGPYMPEDVVSFGLVAPYLQRIVTLAFRFRQALEAPLADFAGQLGRNTVHLDWSGRVTDVSPGTQKLFEGALRIRNGRLEAERNSDDRLLQALLHSALRGATPAGQTGRSAVAIRRQGKAPLVVEAITPPTVLRDVFTQAGAIVILRDLERSATADQLLSQLFGVTPAEARVANLVGSGLSPQEVAHRLGVKKETVRTQLRMVYGKLDVSHQSELAALLGRLLL